MMHLARLAGLDDEADRRAQALADQVMMHGGGGQQRRHRNAVRADHAVGQDDDVVAAMHGLLGAVAQARQRLSMPGAPRGRIGDVERLGVERILEMADGADLLQIARWSGSAGALRAACGANCLEVEQVRARADERHEAHHQLLADRIDRRVGHLREVLLEIGVEQLRLVESAEIGVSVPIEPMASWPVVAIGAIRIASVFLRVAEGLLAIEQRHVGARGARLDGLGGPPARSACASARSRRDWRRRLRLDLLVGDDAALLEIDQQHLARLQAPLA
jgi:hypothetical protein